MHKTRHSFKEFTLGEYFVLNFVLDLTIWNLKRVGHQ